MKISKFTFETLLADSENIEENFNDYLARIQELERGIAQSLAKVTGE